MRSVTPSAMMFDVEFHEMVLRCQRGERVVRGRNAYQREEMSRSNSTCSLCSKPFTSTKRSWRSDDTVSKNPDGRQTAHGVSAGLS